MGENAGWVTGASSRGSSSAWGLLLQPQGRSSYSRSGKMNPGLLFQDEPHLAGKAKGACGLPDPIFLPGIPCLFPAYLFL